MAPDIIQADMNHADPNTMRARARQATEILKTQLLGTGAIEPLVALYFDDQIKDTDQVGDFGGVRLVVDKMSAPYLMGAEIDYVDSLQQSGFTINNPNAQSTCACGDSFH